MNDGLKRYRRLIISIQDIADARGACKRLRELDEFDEPTGSQSLDFRANLTQLIVAYGRPFKWNNDDAEADPKLDVLDAFSENDLRLHDRLVGLRDQEFAHSDSGPAGLHVYVDDDGVTPIGRVTRYASLTRDDVILVERMLSKLDDAVWKAKQEIEPRLPHGKY